MRKRFNNRPLTSAALNFVSILLTVFLMLVWPTPINAQLDTVIVKGDVSPGEGNLNKAIEAVIKSGKLSKTVIKLELNSRYVLTDSIQVSAGEHLTILAPNPGITQETAPPQILCSTKFSYPENKKYNFHCYGNITLKNIWLLYANTEGSQIQINLQFDESPNAVNDHIGVFENIIFDYSSIPQNASGAVGVAVKHFKGTFKNCYFKNFTDQHFRYYGRAVSFPFDSRGWHIDSLSFENCTFANIGYVYMQEGGEYADNVKFNHCTFLNVVMYCLESGWWYKMAVTNSIFVNTYMYGDQLVFSKNSGPEGGTIRIDSISSFGFNTPFTELDRQILFTHSSYYIEKWLSNWMSENPASKVYFKDRQFDYIPKPQPMLNQKTISFFETAYTNGRKIFPLMNKAYLYDGENPGLINPPSDTVKIKSFLMRKWWDSSDENWAYYPQHSIQYQWPMQERLAYSNPIILKAAMGEFPLGDLYRWFPEKYSVWKAQQKSEDERISTWLNTGKDPETVDVDDQIKTMLPSSNLLYQNYPNPFNPNTTISFSLSMQSDVRLVLIDLLGREVMNITAGKYSAGQHRIQLNALNLASGIYIYRLTAGNFSTSKKMILIK